MGDRGTGQPREKSPVIDPEGAGFATDGLRKSHGTGAEVSRRTSQMTLAAARVAWPHRTTSTFGVNQRNW